MADTMFRDLVEPPETKGRARGCTVAFSIVVHTLVILAAIIVPLIATGVDLVPVASSIGTFTVAAALPPQPLPPAAPQPHGQPTPPAPVNQAVAPLEPPPDIAPERAFPGPAEATVGAEIPGTVVGEIASLAPPPPPPPPLQSPAAVEQGPVPVGGDVKPPRRIKGVAPIYPALAQAAHVQGAVTVEATIDQAGNVVNARVVRSIPLLDQAALDAVRQWEYTPTMLNGTAISIVMTVTVEFRLR